jgi:hypothetical protein
MYTITRYIVGSHTAKQVIRPYFYFKGQLTHATVDVVLTPVTQILYEMSQKDLDTNPTALRTKTGLTPLHLINRYVAIQ